MMRCPICMMVKNENCPNPISGWAAIIGLLLTLIFLFLVVTRC